MDKNPATIEQQALALVNEARSERGFAPAAMAFAETDSGFRALCRALERHEAFRQEVSEAAAIWQKVFDHLNEHRPGDSVAYFMGEPVPPFSRFIIAPPVDPLAEIIRELWPEISEKYDVAVTDGVVRDLRAALARHGLQITGVET